jgi:hypothetical protein
MVVVLPWFIGLRESGMQHSAASFAPVGAISRSATTRERGLEPVDRLGS